MIGWLLKFAGGLSGRLWGALALAGVLAGAGAWAWHSIDAKGYQRGAAEVQGKWDKDIIAREERYLGEIQRQALITQEIERDLSEKVAAAESSVRGLAGRVLRYQRELDAARLALASAAPRPADGAGGDDPDPEAAGRALEQGLQDHLDACAVVTVKYTELQGWVRGVIVRDPVPFTNSEQTP